MSISTDDFLRFKGGIEQNDFTKILNLGADENTVRAKSLYHNVDDLKNFLTKNKNKITVLSLNIDSLNSKFDELNILIHTLAESNVFISVICIQEARIGENSNVEHLNLKNYKMITQAYTDRCSRKGGLVTYLLNSIPLANQTMYNTYSTWEGLFVDIVDDSGKNITICNIYRPPRNNNNHVSIDSFLLDFSPVVQTLSTISKNVMLAGDFNIDLLKLNSNSKYQEFYYTLSEFDFLPIITLPTRISKRHATLIDHMYCKSPNPLKISESGILATKISDHMATFVALNFNINKNCKHLDTICTRSFTGNKINCFLGELEKINWPQIFDHDTTADPLITYDQQFSTKLDEVINTHFPLTFVKFNKHKHKKCKWMTHTLLTKI